MIKTTIIYGIGNYFHIHKEQILRCYNVDYVCDAKLNDVEDRYYEGLLIMKTCDAWKLHDDVRVVICTFSKENAEEIKRSFIYQNKVEFVLLSDIFKDSLTSLEIKEKSRDGRYIDGFGNIVEYENDISDNIVVYFRGYNSYLKISKDVYVMKEANIYLGTQTKVSIENCNIVSVNIYASWGNISIGNDCLISYGVEIRNHDGHHIFSDDGRRLNYSGDIQIGEHVWLGEKCLILKGILIGHDSVVGAGSVLTKSVEPRAIVAGNPARVIKKNITWDMKNTDMYNLECVGGNSEG